jgi:hypothetical protein
MSYNVKNNFIYNNKKIDLFNIIITNIYLEMTIFYKITTTNMSGRRQYIYNGKVSLDDDTQNKTRYLCK